MGLVIKPLWTLEPGLEHTGGCMPTARFIKTKVLQPYYIIYGDNDLFKQEFIKEMLEVFLAGKIDPSAIHTFNLSDKEGEVTAGAIIEQASTMSFFSERNFIVVKEFQKLKKDDLEKLMAFLPSAPEACNIVLTSSLEHRDMEKRILGPYKIPGASVFNFSSGHTGDIKKWSRDYLAAAGKQIDEEVLDYLIEEANSDAIAIKNELDKMLLISGDRAELGKKDFNDVRGVDREYDIWALTAALGNRDEKKAFMVLDKIYEDIGPEGMLGALFSEIKKIYIVRYYTGRNEDAKAMKYVYNNPRALGIIRQYVKNFRNAPYVDILNIVKDADKRIKLSSRQNGKTILVMMLQKIFLRLEK
jgi:DNA polymerase-3 subunit delta